MPDHVSEWLEKLGLDQYGSNFTDNDIDTQLLAHLTDADLKELGISSLGHRKTILSAIEALGQEVSEPSKIKAAKGEAERRQLTVMFCDLVGSTKLSQQLDPEDLRDVNRAYQDACKAAIERYEGYVARYMGDGVLVYFGYPQAHEDDAERAIHAGLSVIDAMDELNETFGDKLGIELGVRVGIATGPVVVGLLGSRNKGKYTVVGDAVVTAQRLESTDKVPHDFENQPCRVLLSERTHSLMEQHSHSGGFEPMGEVTLKGKHAPIGVYKMVGGEDQEPV